MFTYLYGIRNENITIITKIGDKFMSTPVMFSQMFKLTICVGSKVFKWVNKWFNKIPGLHEFTLIKTMFMLNELK